MKLCGFLATPLMVFIMLFAFTIDANAATCKRLAVDFTRFSWNDATKWDCGIVPGPNDIAVIPKGENVGDAIANIELNNDITLRGLIMEDGRIEGKYTMTVTEQVIWSGGDLHYTNTVPFKSPSVLVVGPGATMTIQVDESIISSQGTIINYGTAIWKTGTYTFSPPFIGSNDNRFINHGDFTATLAKGTWGGSFENHGNMVIESESGVTSNFQDAISFGLLTNHGNLTITNSSLSASFRQVTGTTSIESGKLLVSSFEHAELDGGRMQGKGTIVGGLVNSGGILAPTGTLRIESDFPGDLLYTQESGGTLEMPIAGTQRGSEYGSLSVSGRATLAGTLDPRFADGFTPGPDDGFAIIECASCEGEFDTNTSALTINYGQSLFSLGAEIELQSPLRLPFIINVPFEDDFDLE